MTKDTKKNKITHTDVIEERTLQKIEVYLGDYMERLEDQIYRINDKLDRLECDIVRTGEWMISMRD